MSLSDVIAFLALSISGFTFYWTSMRVRKAFYLVRINSLATRMHPEFALINAGNVDILVTSILCAFEDGDGKGWESPDGQRVVDGGSSFSLPAGISHHCLIELPSNFDESFVKTGVLKRHGTSELYHKDMMVIVEWVDSKGIEHKAEPKIGNYGFNINGHATIFRPLVKRHDLYKKIPNK